jgi:protein-S-isoprenylcysteine O-methyltransferase Ste14
MLIGGAFLGYYLDAILFNNIHSNLFFHTVSFFIGIIILWAVVKVSRNTGRSLAKYGREGNIKRMETNVLASEGIYKYMRHPMHLGLLFFPVGFAFLIGSPSFILIIAPLEIIFMLIMIKFVEEPEAIKKFGDDYKTYMKQVPGFCFSIICLKELFKDVPKNNVKK